MAPPPLFDSSEVKDKARRDLLDLLEGVRGKKNLVIEKSLAGPLGTIAKVSTLHEYGVDKFFFLENANTDTSQRNVVFVARGECGRHTQAIADQIRRLQRESQTGHEFHIFWVPRRTLVSNSILEEAGVLGDVNIAELPLFFFPLEPDLLSLELDEAFQDLYLAKDPSPVFLLSRALMGIQQRHGLFPRIIGKGDNARRVAGLLARMRQELLAGEDANEFGAAATGNGGSGAGAGPDSVAGIGGSSKIGLMPSTTIESVILIDRDVDPVTPLLTQLTYEGLIDEFFGIQNSQTDIDQTIVGVAAGGAGGGSSTAERSAATASSTASASAPGARKRRIQLDSADKLYGQLRDANFAVVGRMLNRVARRLQTDFQGRHNSRTTAELRDFVQKLPGYQAEQASLKIHAGLVEEIYKHTRSDEFSSLLEVQQNLAAGADPSAQVEALEELIARDTPLPQVLRLLCIYSCVSGGIKAKEHDQFRRLILQAYGYQHLLTLQNLERLQMFLPRSSPLAGMIPMVGSSSVGTGSGSGASSGSALAAASASAAAGSKTNYTVLRKQLRLIVDEVSEQDPNDIAYGYSGYAPLSVRLVQCILQKSFLLGFIKGGNGAGSASARNGSGNGAGASSGETASVPTAATAATAAAQAAVSSGGGGAQGWRGFDDAVKHVRGATFDELQKGEDRAVKARALLSGSGGKKTVFVVFVGGVTFTEIAALRFIAKQEEARRNIVICTTSIVSGNKIMTAAIEPGSFRRDNTPAAAAPV